MPSRRELTTTPDPNPQLWDTQTSTQIAELDEHGQRVWSVHYSPTDPTRIVSGSDDGTVRLWSVRDDRSVTRINTGANVCCAQFSPVSCNLVAVASANSNVLLYDLRHSAEPLQSLAGHARAVSFVRFISGSEVGPQTLS